MTNNKQGQKEGLSGSIRPMMDSRGDPDIGRIKRSRVESYGFAVNRLTGNILPECEKNVRCQLSIRQAIDKFSLITDE